MKYINDQSEPETVWFTMSKAAKLAGKMGRNKLYSFLREKGILMKHNEPYQKYCDTGYFKLDQVPKYSRWGSLISYFPVLKVSPEGVNFIRELTTGEQPARSAQEHDIQAV